MATAGSGTDTSSEAAADAARKERAEKLEGGSAALSPFKRYFQRLNAAVDTGAEGPLKGLGRMIVRGMRHTESEYSDEEDEEDAEESPEKDEDEWTEEEVAYMRWIIITQRRADALEHAAELVLGDQAHESFQMFNTSFSYEVIESFDQLRQEYSRTSDWGARFDMLFAYTHTIAEQDVWMHDHEVGWGGERWLASLAKLWRAVLQKSDAILAIDAEFTRPGVLHMLEKFKANVEDIEQLAEYGDKPIKFKFRPAPESEHQEAAVAAAGGAGAATTVPTPRLWCDCCGDAKGKLVCSRCKAVGYCSKACQKESWKGSKRRAPNGDVQPGHKLWCIPPAEVEALASALTKLIATPLVMSTRGLEDDSALEALQDMRLKNSPSVYAHARDQQGLHGVIIEQMRAEAADLRERGGRLFKYGVSFTQYVFNSLLSGMALVNDDGERVFVRRGNSCCDEERVLGLLRSDDSSASAWPSLMSVVHAMLRVHFDSKTASRREISMQVQKIRDISVAFCYALSMESIAAFILGSHVQNTWAEYAAWLEIIFAAEAEDKAAGDTPSARPELDPGGTLQGYIMTIANILREQAVALHGKAWARTTLPLASLKVGFEDNPVKFGMFSSLGRANALAFIEKKCSIQMADINRHMERCKADMLEERSDGEDGQDQEGVAESMDVSSDDDDL